MLRHVVLGLLRDGNPRHGYALMTDYRARVGEALNAGTIYRELRRLAAAGLVSMAQSPPEDPRRIPYDITDEGRRLFDDWLADPRLDDSTFAVWMLFLGRLPAAERITLLARREADLCRRAVSLERAQHRARGRRNGSPEYGPLLTQLSRRLKLVRAELEFVRELRLSIGDGPRPAVGSMTVGSAVGPSGDPDGLPPMVSTVTDESSLGQSAAIDAGNTGKRPQHC